ncbi:hypothetical protein [Nostoc sp.]
MELTIADWKLYKPIKELYKALLGVLFSLFCRQPESSISQSTA